MKRAATLLLVLCVAALARATDRPPPGPEREGPPKVVPVTTVVDALEDVSDYAFFEVWQVPAVAPREPLQGVTLHFFQPSSAAYASQGGTRTSTLFAVPRGAAEHIPGWKDFAAEGARAGPLKHTDAPSSEEEWFRLADRVRKGEVPRAASIPFVLNENGTVTDGRPAIHIHYRLTRTPTGLAFVKVELPPRSGDSGDIGKCGNDGANEGVLGEVTALRNRSIPWGWIAFGVAGFLVFALAGAALVWHLARRA